MDQPPFLDLAKRRPHWSVLRCEQKKRGTGLRPLWSTTLWRAQYVSCFLVIETVIIPIRPAVGSLAQEAGIVENGEGLP